MEFIAVVIVIWVLWSFFAGRSRKGSSDSTIRERREPSSTRADHAWQEIRENHETTMQEHRPSVLLALREGRLNQKQIANVLEPSNQFGFSSAELAELRESLHAPKPMPNKPGRSTCRVCGHPAMPGEDLCYSHHAK